MSIKHVDEKLCTEPMDNTLDVLLFATLQFAIVYEGGLKRQRTIGNPCTSALVKEEPVFAVTQKANNKECWRCGVGKNTAVHLNDCKGPDPIWNYCGKEKQFERCCDSKQKDSFGKMPIAANLTKGTNLENVCRKSITTKKTKVQKKTWWW